MMVFERMINWKLEESVFPDFRNNLLNAGTIVQGYLALGVPDGAQTGNC